MGAHKIEITPELAAEGRRLYERTLENRIREWNWTRRLTPAHPVELHHAMRGAVIVAATRDVPAGDTSLAPVMSQQRAAVALRIQSAVALELAAIERVLEKNRSLRPR